MQWCPEPFDCITPLGPASCIACVWNTDNPEWVCVIDATGEVFNFGNEFFRVASSVTSGRPDVSPFENINAKTQRQIERYKRNGWL